LRCGTAFLFLLLRWSLVRAPYLQLAHLDETFVHLETLGSFFRRVDGWQPCCSCSRYFEVDRRCLLYYSSVTAKDILSFLFSSMLDFVHFMTYRGGRGELPRGRPPFIVHGFSNPERPRLGCPIIFHTMGTVCQPWCQEPPAMRCSFCANTFEWGEILLAVLQKQSLSSRWNADIRTWRRHSLHSNVYWHPRRK